MNRAAHSPKPCKPQRVLTASRLTRLHDHERALRHGTR